MTCESSRELLLRTADLSNLTPLVYFIKIACDLVPVISSLIIFILGMSFLVDFRGEQRLLFISPVSLKMCDFVSYYLALLKTFEIELIFLYVILLGVVVLLRTVERWSAGFMWSRLLFWDGGVANSDFLALKHILTLDSDSDKSSRTASRYWSLASLTF